MADIDFDDQNGRLMLGIGHCIMQWSFVELYLGLIFHSYDDDHETTDHIWNRMRSFEAKSLVVNDVVSAKCQDPNLVRDWRLLREKMMSLYRKRNQVAHATAITVKGEPRLEPFALPFAETKLVLSADDLSELGFEFMELAKELLKLNGLLRGKKPRPQSPEQEPGLLGRLRKRDDQMREAQRHRELALRQYRERNPDVNF